MTGPPRSDSAGRPEAALSDGEQAIRDVLAHAARELESESAGASARWCLDYCTSWLRADGAGLVELARDGEDDSGWAVTASHDAVLRLCEVDLFAHAGPCRACLAEGRPRALVGGQAAGPGWEEFAAHMRAAGFAWSLAQPLLLAGRVVGALQLFGSTSGPPAEDDWSFVTALAELTVALRAQQSSLARRTVEVGQLRTALDSRLVIEQAKGVLSVRHDISLQQAFDRLRTQARSQRRNIHELARDVVEGQDVEDRS